MSRWSADGVRNPTTLLECAALQYTIKATCQAQGCAHSAVFQPHALWWLFHRKAWWDDFRHAYPRFRCTACGAKRAKIEPARDPVTVDTLPLPPEGEWKRAVNRFRG